MRGKFEDHRGFTLLMFELAPKCLAHLQKDGKSNTPNNSNELTEKEIAALQSLSAHVLHKIYLILRKSQHDFSCLLIENWTHWQAQIYKTQKLWWFAVYLQWNDRNFWVCLIYFSWCNPRTYFQNWLPSLNSEMYDKLPR